MPLQKRRKEWSVVLFGLLLLIIFPPIITIYDIPDLVVGVPLSFLVLFVLWGLVIVATAVGAALKVPGGDGDTAENVSHTDEGATES